MSNIQTFDSSTTLRVCEEGYDMTKQEYYSKKRCTFSCCDCFHKKCAFRVWHILLFLFIIIVIIGALVVIIAMFGPARSPDMKYSKRIGSDTPEGVCKGNCTRWVYQEPAFYVLFIILIKVAKGPNARLSCFCAGRSLSYTKKKNIYIYAKLKAEDWYKNQVSKVIILSRCDYQHAWLM